MRVGVWPKIQPCVPFQRSAIFCQEIIRNIKCTCRYYFFRCSRQQNRTLDAERSIDCITIFQTQIDATHTIDGEPGKFYKSMIEPLIPFAVKGLLWYQGESNCFLNERLQYAYKMKALIDYWRKAWNNNELPFYYVQIAPYAYSKTKDSVKSYTEQSLPEFWEAQSLVLKMHHTAMIATTDLNDDINNLHPHYKWEIGKRLAVAALATIYSQKGFIPMGPVYQSMNISGNKIIIDFAYNNGLTINNATTLSGFEIAAADNRYVPADAVIVNNKVEVSSPAVTKPVSVRYHWNEAAHSNLYNVQGLPALPFRTNNPFANQFK